MRFQIANSRQVILTFALSLLVGFVLGYGFISLSYRLLDGVLGDFKLLSFPLLALFFVVSLPHSSHPVLWVYPQNRLLTLCVLPLIIALGFGVAKSFRADWNQAIWAWFIVPVGEELLFRGWVTSLLNRLNKNTFWGVAPLYPLSLWGSALAFSAWHLQNFDLVAFNFLIFQCIYTFCVGIWLGFIKWQTRKLWPCILAHCLLNLSADCKLWFML
ncbi:MAG: lysostaphin resistance A-like protein [Pseudomonadota bacterium]